VEFKIVKTWFDNKGKEAAEKYFYQNSRAAYKWIKR